MTQNSVEIFTLNRDVLFYDTFRKHCITDVIYPDLSEVQKGIRHIHFSLLPKYHQLWFSNTFKTVGKYKKTIIVFDSVLSVPAANYIKKKYPELRVIYYFWNHINNEAILSNLNRSIERWSYDPVDCEKFNLKLNSQFYFKDFIEPNDTDTILQYDFCFVGKEKGRQEILSSCENLFNKLNLSYKFIIIGNSRKNRLHSWVPYNEIVSLIKKSKCILDIVPPDQHGLTLRPLEALFHRKKLLTNFNRISDYNFYCKDNIECLNNNIEHNLLQFLSSPYRPIDHSIIDYYDFDSWIKRFDV